MTKTSSAADAWLGLDEAARRLHVHPTTLREWADRGRIRSYRTPGGHRRFSEADVDALSAGAAPDLSLLMNATVGHARIATSTGRLVTESWYAHFDEDAKDRHRRLGQDLVHSLVEFLGAGDRDWTPEITGIGARYAALARDTGLSLADALRAFYLFEGMVRSSVDELAAVRAGGSAELERQAGWFLNEVRVAMVDSFAKESVG